MDILGRALGLHFPRRPGRFLANLVCVFRVQSGVCKHKLAFAAGLLKTVLTFFFKAKSARSLRFFEGFPGLGAISHKRFFFKSKIGPIFFVSFRTITVFNSPGLQPSSGWLAPAPPGAVCSNSYVELPSFLSRGGLIFTHCSHSGKLGFVLFVTLAPGSGRIGPDLIERARAPGLPQADQNGRALKLEVGRVAGRLSDSAYAGGWPREGGSSECYSRPSSDR